MKYVVILLTGILLVGCESSYNLDGKWAGRDPDGGYMELWFGDSLALSYFQGYDEFVLYSYKRTGDEIHFRVKDSELEGLQEFDNTIITLDHDTLILEYEWPNGALQQFNYRRILSAEPVIYPDNLNIRKDEYRNDILNR